jgi:2-oxoglutarate ferredoxin oxidoreductase subunit delta
MIIIDDDYCKGCGICIWFCAKNVLALRNAVNTRGFYAPYVVDAGACSHCRQCELFCPDFAVFVVEDD